MGIRPKRHSPEIQAIAITRLAKDCCEWDREIGLDGWKSILGRCHPNDNGYEIARSIDHSVSGINLELVEILDNASSHLYAAHREAVKAWTTENEIKPTIPVGTRMQHRGRAGEIRGVDLEMAYYLFVPDEEQDQFKGGGGYCVDYEDTALTGIVGLPA